jgi:hypothetical protein
MFRLVSRHVQYEALDTTELGIPKDMNKTFVVQTNPTSIRLSIRK